MKKNIQAVATPDKPGEPAIVTALFARRLAQPIAKVAVALGIPANAVTIFGGCLWMASLPLAQLAGWETALGASCAPWLWIACAILWCAGYIFDVADGSVARMTGTQSSAGFFLDYVFHVLFKPAFLFSIGCGMILAGVSYPLMPLLVILSVPANGSQPSHCAESALAEGAKRDLVSPERTNRNLWAGSAIVSAPAEQKKGGTKGLGIIIREIVSYYLQAPFFALPVIADAALMIANIAPSSCPMPCTAVVWILLTIVLIFRIPFRCIFEHARLGLIQERHPRNNVRKIFASRLACAFAVPLAFCIAWAAFAIYNTANSILLWGAFFAIMPITVSTVVPFENLAASHVFCQTVAKNGDSGTLIPRKNRRIAPLVFAILPLLCVFICEFVVSSNSGLCERATFAANQTALFTFPLLGILSIATAPFRIFRVWRKIASAKKSPQTK